MSADLPLTKNVHRTPDRRVRDRLIIAGLVVLFVAGLIGLAAATGWQETRAQIARLTLWQGAVLLALSLVNYVFRGLRWHLFTRRLGLPTTLGQNMRHFLGGFAMVVTPGRLGELVRMRWLRRETGWAFERTAPLALVDRASDLAAMALILGLSVSLTATGVTGAVPVTILALMAAYVATRPRLLAGCVTLAHRLIGRLPRLFGRIRTAARSLDRFSGLGVTAPALGLGIIGWMAEGYAFHLLLGWMGADIGLMKAIAIFVFATLAGGLTGAPGGVGGAEAAMIALLALDGVPMDVSVPATAIIRVTTLWFALGVGMAVFPFAERLSLRGVDALEKD
ncbi:MAG: lysylphosphatidylglycerol synthase transmembrane domain-containing protein [Albidovulum sp.]|uniref:lysylphosphatidylglycerol synthase transmembrane domain-containing protein n=1 Tax=Albidovulum sp. TaxID=1872424 RepID=UPI003CB999EE